jgi:hypothetical protein
MPGVETGWVKELVRGVRRILESHFTEWKMVGECLCQTCIEDWVAVISKRI